MKPLYSFFNKNRFAMPPFFTGFIYALYRNSHLRFMNLVRRKTRNARAKSEAGGPYFKLGEDYIPQQILIDSSHLLETILATVADGIILFDVPAQAIKKVNIAAQKMFDYSEAELTGLCLSTIIPDLYENKEQGSDFVSSENGAVRELTGKTKNGDIFPLEIQISEISIGGQRHYTAILRNITDRKNAEVVIRKSEDRYRALFNTIDEGFCTAEIIYGSDRPIDFLILEVNPSFEKQTGMSNVVGKRILDILPGFEKSSLETYARVLASGESIRFVQYQRALKRWFDVYACTEPSNRKNITILFTDITQRKQYEQALRESNERVRLAAEATGVGIWEWKLGQGKIHWDAQMFRIYGIAPTFDGFVDYDDWATTLLPEELRALRMNSTDWVSVRSLPTREFRMRPEGRKRSRYIRSVEIMRPDADGRVESIVGTNLDITETKKIEKRLRENERHLRAVIDALPVAVYTTDAEGALTHFNQAAVEFAGRTPELGKDHWCISMKLLRPDGSYLPHGECPMAIALKGKRQLLGAETVAERPDGTRVWFNAYPTPLYSTTGKLVGGINMLVDVTERKRLDQVILENNIELKKARFLADKANLAKSEFLSNMSHELRTPLSAILGFAQLLETSNPPPTPSQKRSVEQVLQAGWYLLHLINEILDLTLVESGKLSLSMEPVSLHDLLRECKMMLEANARTRKIELDFPELDNSVKVFADYIRLKQIFINLLSNAVKYNRENGKVTVTCYESSPQQLRVCVQDTGSGLAPDDVAQLFQPFNRLGRERGPEEGTGIGLVMTKRLIELMGGKIGVESQVGEGTLFWFDLDLVSVNSIVSQNESIDADAGERQLTQVGSTGSKRTLLYVEDNAANLMLVEDIIASYANLTLISTRDGYQGIEIARLTQPDLILMDINLPGISGTEALKILAKDPITTHIPVIALSANALPRDIEKGLRAGFFRYITKPIKISEFMNAIDLALEVGARKSTKANDENIL